jgi:hypothetical protein
MDPMASMTCPGSGSQPVVPANVNIGENDKGLASTWPHYRGLCGHCNGFYAPNRDGSLRKHVFYSGPSTEYEAEHRNAWFAQHGVKEVA